jgi:gliding motility-associated-like protein
MFELRRNEVKQIRKRKIKMKKIAFIHLFLFLVNAITGGNPSNPKKFVSGKDVFGTRNFIENKGQFDKDLMGDYTIEALLDNGQEKIFFTNKGLVYELVKRYPLTEEQREAMEKGKHVTPKPAKIYHVNMNWLNANPNIAVEKSEKQSHYFTYGEAKYNSYAYKKLTYKNVYPNIDIEYIIPEDKDYGIKYNVIVHPGANVADIKIAYTGDVDKIKQTNDGNILIKTPLDDITEHAPTTFYENKQEVESLFSLKDGIIGFNLPKGYNKNQTLIIDPFVSSATSLTSTNFAFDVDYDYGGNTYIYGGLQAFKVAMYNSAGILQWTFSGIIASIPWSTAPFVNGDAEGNIAVDKANRKTYVGQGLNSNTGLGFNFGNEVIRLDAAGNYDNFAAKTDTINPEGTNFNEVWDIIVPCSTNSVILLGGGNFTLNAVNIDVSTGSSTPISFMPPNIIPSRDVISHAIDEAGSIFLIIGCNSVNCGNNGLYSVNSAFNGNIWNQWSGFNSFSEFYNKSSYLGYPGVASNGFNCLAVNNNYLFYYDGSNLAAYNKANGVLITSINVPSLTLMQQGGIAVDECNNLYLGGNSSILSYDFDGINFNALPSIPLGSSSANPYVFDIKLDKINGLLYVCGNGLVGVYSAINSQNTGTSVASFTYSTINFCSPNTYSFSPPITPTFVCAINNTPSYSWFFGDAVSGSADTSYLANPIHFYGNAGAYTVTLNIIYPCAVITRTQTIVITNSVVGIITTTNASCSNVSNGSASIAVPGISAGASYTWANGFSTQITSIATATNLSTGFYTITAADPSFTCPLIQTFQITSPPPLTINIVASSPTACAGTNITFTANTSGGTAGYTYTWTGGPNTQTRVVSQAIGGIYTYTVNSSDTNTCLLSNTVSVNFQVLPAVVIIPIPSICPLQTASLSAFGATNYTWLPTVSIGNTFTVNPASTSVYSVIGSVNGCVGTAVTTTVSVKPIPIPTLTSNSPVCSTQTLNLFAIGANTYQWSGPLGFISGAQNPTINPVSLNNAGTYSALVTGLNSCTAIATTSITILAPPSITISSAPACENQNLNLFSNAGAGATYTWSGISGLNSNLQNPVIANVALSQSGLYNVRVTSIQGCTNNAVVNALVVPPPFPVATLVGNGTLCAQALNGSPNTITLTSSGANAYTLSTPAYIANNNPSGSVNNLFTIPPFQNVTTVATATLTGSNGVCTNSSTVTFTIIPNPTVSVSSPTPVICAGQSFTYTSNGASSYTWSAGTPGLTTYTSPITIASPTVTSVYSVVGGSLGCNSGTQTNTLTVNPLPVLIPSSGSVCIGSAITLSVGGTAVNFTWSPNVGLSTTNGSTINASPSGYQTYNIVGEANTCTSSAQTFVYVWPLPTPTSSVSKNPICLNEITTLQGFGVGSSGGYEWKGPDGSIYLNQNVDLLAYNMDFAGTYTLIVTDGNGCKNATTTNLNIQPLPRGLLSGNNAGCIPFCTTLTFSSNSPSTTATWQYNQQLVSNQTSLSFTKCFNTMGNHQLTGYLFDAITGCSNTITSNITVYEKPQANFEYNPNKPIEGFDEVNFNSTSKGDNLSKYTWYFNANVPVYNNTGYQADTKSTNYLFDKAGIYTIALIVKNTWGCVDTVTKGIRVEPDFNVYVPNSFTPNEDDVNEVFQAKGTGIKLFKLFVFNRWGEQVFEANDITKGWDGNFKGQPCKSDVYVWKIRVTDTNGKVNDLQGHVTLYR